MKRRAFLAGLAAGVALATPAAAQDYVDSVVRQLKRLGFASIAQERTLLGRVRITASRGDGKREIVLNPRTGEVLRDLWFPGGGSSAGVTVIDDRGGNDRDDDENGGNDDEDDDDDDDDDDEDNDDDGEGGGSGGSGGSGGGDDDDDDDDGGDDDED
jgi:hypothetical protein